MKMYELIPTNSQKSFYKKAMIKDEKNKLYLYSYNTLIASMNKLTGKVERLCEYDSCTATTLKHVRSFCSLNKKEFLSLKFQGV